jgi:hypothetical protein
MDIEERKDRLNAAADQAGVDRVAWYGEMGDECQRCGVQVSEGYMLALPNSDVSGCLRCLEYQAHLFLAGLQNVPDDLAGTGDQFDALRRVAEEFRAHIKAAVRGREAPSRKQSASRWAAQSGWEASSAWEPLEREKTSRWPEKGSRSIPRAPQRSSKPRHRSRPQPPPQPAPQPSGPADLLGLAGVPTRDDIISAFRRCALICHPDYGGTAEAFREIVKARDALLAMAVDKKPHPSSR